MAVNGDAHVIETWGESALVAVIDGLGHGQHAHRASRQAQLYIASHAAQPFDLLFRGVEDACRTTRGVVMALARFDWREGRMTFAGIGNIEVRILGCAEPIQLPVRRGIIGGRAPRPAIAERRWDPHLLMVLHSDGVTARWNWEDFPQLADAPADLVARQLLDELARDNDDATVVVVRGHVS